MYEDLNQIAQLKFSTEIESISKDTRERVKEMRREYAALSGSSGGRSGQHEASVGRVQIDGAEQMVRALYRIWVDFIKQRKGHISRSDIAFIANKADGYARTQKGYLHKVFSSQRMGAVINLWTQEGERQMYAVAADARRDLEIIVREHKAFPEDEYQTCSGEEITIDFWYATTINDAAGSDDDCGPVPGIVRGRTAMRGAVEPAALARWVQVPALSGPSRGYMVERQVHECARCSYQCSVTAGTIFHKTRTPLSSWFWAIYRMSHDKKGISAMQLAKEIGVSYPTAWLMLHKICKAMSDRDQGYQLSGLVEVDEGYVGGEEHGEGRCGRGTRGVRTKSVAVERRGAGKPGKKPMPGFAALEVIPDAATATLEQFLADKVKPGGYILSDGWHGYRRLKQKGFEHTATAIPKQEEPAHVLFLWVHITLSNLKRFLLGTHHKATQKHLKHYVAEFNYRLNRRAMEPDLMIRLLRACISTQTITYKQLIAMPELA